MLTVPEHHYITVRIGASRKERPLSPLFSAMTGANTFLQQHGRPRKNHPLTALSWKKCSDRMGNCWAFRRQKNSNSSTAVAAAAAVGTVNALYSTRSPLLAAVCPNATSNEHALKSPRSENVQRVRLLVCWDRSTHSNLQINSVLWLATATTVIWACVTGQTGPVACPTLGEIAIVLVDGVLFHTYYGKCLLRTLQTEQLLG